MTGIALSTVQLWLVVFYSLSPLCVAILLTKARGMITEEWSRKQIGWLFQVQCALWWFVVLITMADLQAAFMAIQALAFITFFAYALVLFADVRLRIEALHQELLPAAEPASEPAEPSSTAAHQVDITV